MYFCFGMVDPEVFDGHHHHLIANAALENSCLFVLLHYGVVET